MNPRVEELLAERALRPLDDKEHWELQQLGATDDESFDMAAAAVMVATTVIEPMPSSLADKILATAPGANSVDWRRTLPGVVMPSQDLPRDTMVGVEMSMFAPDHPAEHPEEKATEPLLAQKPPAATKAMGVPQAALDTLPPPLLKRPPAIPAPSLVDTPDVDPKGETLPPENGGLDVKFAAVHTPMPQPAASKPVVPEDGGTVKGTALAPRTPSPSSVPFTTSEGAGAAILRRPAQPTPQIPLAPVLPVTPPVIPEGRTPLPQDSQPFSVETPPMAVPISRDRNPIVRPRESMDDLAARRQAADTVPLKPIGRSYAPWLAAAACLLIAGGAVWWGMQDRTPKPQPVAVKSVADERGALVASATDLSKITWTVTADAAARGATGDVVWSASQQKGFMRFVGLQQNDPTQFQYQLWIFDKARDQAFPVDGGVFDVTAKGEVIVAINPKLRVNDLALFAVTVEKPGGVVVSKRERIVVTAART